MTHICVSKLTIIGSDNGLSPGRRQAVIRTNAGILLIGPLGINLSKILIEIYSFSFNKMHWKMSSGKCRPFCLGLNVVLTLKRKGRHGDNPGFPLRSWWHTSRNPVNTRVVTLTAFLFLCLIMSQSYVICTATTTGYWCSRGRVNSYEMVLSRPSVSLIF